MGKALAPSSRQSYRNSWKHYRNFHNTFYFGLPLLPVSQEKLAQFIAVSHTNGLKSASITTIISAISYVHKLNNLNNPADSFLIKKLLYSLRRSKVPDIRKAFTLQNVNHITRTLESLNIERADHLTLKTMFVVAFFGLFRIGELSKSKTGVANMIQRQDVSFEFSSHKVIGASITLKSYKHSAGRTATVPLSKQTDRAICPVRLLYKLCKKVTSPGPLFRFNCGCPITCTFFRFILNKCVTNCGLNPTHYTAHSFRIGGATHAHALHLTSSQIQQLGRWKSLAFRKYIRPVPMPL